MKKCRHVHDHDLEVVAGAGCPARATKYAHKPQDVADSEVKVDAVAAAGVPVIVGSRVNPIRFVQGKQIVAEKGLDLVQ